jgi:hypothetical protein
MTDDTDQDWYARYRRAVEFRRAREVVASSRGFAFNKPPYLSWRAWYRRCVRALLDGRDAPTAT